MHSFHDSNFEHNTAIYDANFLEPELGAKANSYLQCVLECFADDLQKRAGTLFAESNILPNIAHLHYPTLFSGWHIMLSSSVASLT
jgi:hypothetical protein